jgi:hypothetical protein
MDKGVARLNIEHYRRLLTTELDDVKRQTILKLLAQEEDTLACLLKREKAEKNRT